MNEVGAGLIVAHHRNEREAARILALANMAGFDAGIGCFDAKFAYWLVRPSTADPAITLAVPLPNHPSYISGHSCNTASYAAVFADAFPSERGQLDAMVEEAGLSRIYGGLHYRFDCVAGQVLGRQVAAQVLATAPTGHRPIPLD
jgi:membrane-associated phospholipid phosphatase